MGQEDAFQQAYEGALRLLGYRPRSVAEVRNRLLHRNFPSGVVEIVLQRLQAQGLLDDEAFARFWRESREGYSPRSRHLIEQELRQKGVATETVANALKGIDEAAAALRAAAAQARRFASLDTATARHRMTQFLRRRGFGWGVIQGVVGKKGSRENNRL